MFGVDKKTRDKIDKAIKRVVSDKGVFDPDTFLSRVIFNIFTNTNGEKKRCLKILDGISNGEIEIQAFKDSKKD